MKLEHVVPTYHLVMDELMYNFQIIITEILINFEYSYLVRVGTAVARWLRCCATNRKVAGSIPAGVTGIFL